MEIIDADLRRSDFTMPVGGLKQTGAKKERTVEQSIANILKRLSSVLPCGYL